MKTDKHVIYSTWAPANNPWSPWVKPAVFAHIPDEMEIFRAPAAPVDVSLYLPTNSRSALVMDLPGALAVAAGLALATRGYRPVPLFNSCPPSEADAVKMTGAAVDARAVLEALVAGTPELAAHTLAPDAPPAFLLDSHRSAPGLSVQPRMFDNRSVVFAADFPSANFLRGQNISCARLVHERSLIVGTDLRYALHHWVRDGITVETLNSAGEPFDLAWPRDGFLGELFERFRAFTSLSRNTLGGFGRYVSESSGG